MYVKNKAKSLLEAELLSSLDLILHNHGQNAWENSLGNHTYFH